MTAPSTSIIGICQSAMTHFENGVPIDELPLNKRGKERLVRCIDLYYRWIKNPNLNPKAMLRELWPELSRFEVMQDYKVFVFLVDQLEQPSRRMDEVRARHNIETMTRIGETQGDWKPIKEANKQLIDVGRLNQPETHNDDVRNTALLPPVWVPIEQIDPERRSLSDEQMRRLAQKYGGVIDEHQQLIEAREAAIIAESEADKAAVNAQTFDEPGEEEDW